MTASPAPFTNANRTKRILIVEDERHLCMTLGDSLSYAGFSVDFAHDGKSGLAKVEKNGYDLVILDVMLPMESGLDVCVQMRKLGLTTPVVLLTARSQTLEKVAGFKAGADDYVTKPFDTIELIARIEALLRRAPSGEFVMRPEGESTFGPVTVDVLRKRVALNGQPVSLTSREFNLLRYLAERSGRTISREELLEEVWGDLSGNLTRTVDMHIATLRQKIEVNPRRPELILTEPGMGYRFQP